jgi:hypothetical protein
MREPSSDHPRRLTRLFVTTAVLVGGLSFAWAELSHDSSCTEGPCPHDGPLIVGAALEAIVVSAYLFAMVALAVKEHQRRSRQTDESGDGRGA